MKWVILVVLFASVVFAQEVAVQNITYASSVNNLSLDALVFTNNASGLKPILVVMHSYAGTSMDVVDLGVRFAEVGILVIAPNLRGRSTSESYTLGDDSMYDLFDIYDAINEGVNSFSGDAKNVNILGYSGGGGNAMQMVQKFPDLFNNAYSYFGIPNYCDGDSWYEDGLYSRDRLNWRIGNGRDDLWMNFNNRCLARNSLKQIPNALKTNIRLFVDEDEVIAPLRYSQAYAWEYQKRGLILNVHLDVSSEKTPFRYTHGYPKDVPDLRAAEQSIAMEVLKGMRNVSLPVNGSLRVGGYVKTKPFSVFLGDEVWEGNVSKGREGLAEVNYDLRSRSFSFTDKSYAPGVKNATLILHERTAAEKVKVVLDGRSVSSVADEFGNVVFFIDFEKNGGQGVPIGLMSVVGVLFVLVLAVGVRRKFR